MTFSYIVDAALLYIWNPYRSYASWLQIINQTSCGLICKIIKMDPDFQSDSPGNFHNRTISSHRNLKYRAEIWNMRWGYFKMRLSFDNGTHDIIEANMYGAFKERCINGKRTGDHIIAFECRNDTLIITVKNTSQQIKDEKVEAISREAVLKTAAKLYTEAIKLYNHALTLGGSPNMNNFINVKKSGVMVTMADISFKNGFSLENQYKIDEANAAFQNAKVTLENAKAVSYNQEIDNKLEMVNSKIIGNELFNQGLALDETAFITLNNSAIDVKEKQTKLQATLQKYNKAKEAFERGSKHDTKLFSECLNRTQGLVENIQGTIQDLVGIDLDLKLDKLQMKEYEEEKEEFQIEQHLEEQIDGIME